MIRTFDEGWSTTASAEHDLQTLAANGGLQVVRACTHFAAAPGRVVVTVEDGSGLETDGTWWAQAHARREAGRAFRFPGEAALTGIVTLEVLLARTAIDRVVLIGAGALVTDTSIDTGGFVRPVHTAGTLTLAVRPGPTAAYLPFERPDPTPCCAMHGA